MPPPFAALEPRSGAARQRQAEAGSGLERSFRDAGRAVESAFEGAIQRGESLSDVLKSLALDPARLAAERGGEARRSAAALAPPVPGLHGHRLGAHVNHERSIMTVNRKRGEVTLELDGEKYVLRPEFGVIAEIEDELDTDMFRLGMRAEQFKFRIKELAHALQIILEANGYEAQEKGLANAIAKQGMAAVVLPLMAYVRGYIWGAQPEKKADPAATETPAAEAPTKPGKRGKRRTTSSES